MTLYFAFCPLYGKQITSLMQKLSLLLSPSVSKCDLWRDIYFCLVGFPGYSSSSSSTTSLEGKQNYSKKRNSTSSNKKPLTRASSASSKMSAGMIHFIKEDFQVRKFIVVLNTYVELPGLFQNMRWIKKGRWKYLIDKLKLCNFVIFYNIFKQKNVIVWHCAFQLIEKRL